MASKIGLVAARCCAIAAATCLAALANETYNQRSENVALLFAGTYAACGLGVASLTIVQD